LSCHILLGIDDLDVIVLLMYLCMKQNTFSTCAAAEPSKSSGSDTDDIYDIGIIGGGIVGLAVVS
jgi:hypothetical protein